MKQFSLVLLILTALTSTSFGEEHSRFIPNDLYFQHQWYADYDGRALPLALPHTHRRVPEEIREQAMFEALLRYGMVPEVILVPIELEGKEDVDIDLPEAWAWSMAQEDGLTVADNGVVSFENQDCTIAVIDGGFQLDHPDLEYQIWENPGESGDLARNREDDDGNNLIDDLHGWNFVKNNRLITSDPGHGTTTAGVIVAEMNNGQGIAGVAPGCKLMPLVAVPIHGVAMDEFLPAAASIAASIEYAISKNATVISMSLALPSVETRISLIERALRRPLTTEEREEILEKFTAEETLALNTILGPAIQKAYEANIPVVAAAGNNSNEEKVYPAAFPTVISVASVGNDGFVSEFSTRGRWVDVSAPGEFVLGPCETDVCGGNFPCNINGAICHFHDGYAHPQGTSMAAPLVAGVVAMIKTHFPLLNTWEVRKSLVETGVEVEGGVVVGPLVKAAAALEKAKELDARWF
ncbi:S8 family serine peptidase [Bdellovibrionota bacterium]